MGTEASLLHHKRLALRLANIAWIRKRLASIALTSARRRSHRNPNQRLRARARFLRGTRVSAVRFSRQGTLSRNMLRPQKQSADQKSLFETTNEVEFECT